MQKDNPKPIIITVTDIEYWFLIARLPGMKKEEFLNLVESWCSSFEGLSFELKSF
jgi:hypothetical protein